MVHGGCVHGWESGRVHDQPCTIFSSYLEYIHIICKVLKLRLLAYLLHICLHTLKGIGKQDFQISFFHSGLFSQAMNSTFVCFSNMTSSSINYSCDFELLLFIPERIDYPRIIFMFVTTPCID